MSLNLFFSAMQAGTATVQANTQALASNMAAQENARPAMAATLKELQSNVDEIVKGHKELEAFKQGTMGGWLDSLQEQFENIQSHPLMKAEERLKIERSITLVSQMLRNFGLNEESFRALSDNFYRSRMKGGAGGAPATAPAPAPSISTSLSIGAMK